MQDALIEQIVSRVSSLTDAQVSAMNSVTLPQEAIIEANDVAGDETRAIMTQFADSVDAGVYSVARTAILGIMAKGKVGDEVSAILVRAWTDIVEPLDEGTESVAEPVVEAPHTPTEEELTDLGASVEEIPAVAEAPAVETVAPSVEEVGTSALVDAPLDIHEGEF